MESFCIDGPFFSTPLACCVHTTVVPRGTQEGASLLPADPPLGCLAGAACREVLQASSNEIYREAFPVPRVRPGLLTCYLTCPGTAPHQHIRSHRSLHLRSLVRLADAMADAHQSFHVRWRVHRSFIMYVSQRWHTVGATHLPLTVRKRDACFAPQAQPPLCQSTGIDPSL